ncbi:MAG: hypothetical protein BWX79_02921 [Alphaproteobacteria bacterium ADurb.Bin100]|nr:MAG: hypothetical protein BWX79_02921 [Alphaproteobacteria bacterium ADurb.Bin100]
MRVDRIGRMAAGIKLLAQGLGSGQCRRTARTVGLDRGLERLELPGQGMKRARMVGVGLRHRMGHARADLSRKAGRADLPDAVGQGVHQNAIAPDVVLGRLEQQGLHAVQRIAVQRLDPQRVARIGEQKVKQVDQVIGVGCDGQQLAPQPFAQRTHEGGARRETKVGQEGRRVHRVLEQLPPGAPTLPPLRAGLNGIQHQVDAGHGAGWIGAGTHPGADPLQQGRQPKMALGA